MFGFFASQEKKMRENAGNWLELAEKVYHYRRDVLVPAQVGELQSRIGELQALMKERAGAEKLKIGIERLEEVLRRTGGAIYPKSALVENVEFFLVAAIVILGIRTYFVQPFKIPTNSMWPTYNGMTPQVWKNPADAPGPVMAAVRFALFGARHKEFVAPESGTITAPVARGSGRLYYELKPARSWFIFPSTNREYTLFVNDKPVRIQVPEEFDFDWAFTEATGINLEERTKLAEQAPRGFSNGLAAITLERRAEKGKPFLSFDIITGDQLFVDRVSYHFMPPKVGQGFVFRTDHIQSDFMRDGRTGGQLEQYYIKRLVGVPGDKLEIREPVLYRNGSPITGALAFSENAKRAGKYGGYFNPPSYVGGYLKAGETMTVPKSRYFALGDNSGNSQDGRYWGFVPAKDVVGRPLFVYYPFTSHWGPAR
ncbi:MAG: signal peptidase I [Opitutaceae bacterium]|nr:signal peptidase I [Opitutaceae bacterium]